MPTMLDLCSGINGASTVMRERGWRVISVDYLKQGQRDACLRERRFWPTVLADVLELPFTKDSIGEIDFLWASPPCTEYSKHNQPGLFHQAPKPDMTLYLAIKDVIGQLAPKYWAIENVRGAQKFWGRATLHCGPVYIWTNIEGLPWFTRLQPFKTMFSSREPYYRAETPLKVSELMCTAVEWKLLTTTI